MDPEPHCSGCQIIAGAVTDWANGLMSDAFEVALGTFAGFVERRDCKTCQFVIQYFSTDPNCHAFRPSCCLVLSRVNTNGRFWILPVSWIRTLSFSHSVLNITRPCFVDAVSRIANRAENPMVTLNWFLPLRLVRERSTSFLLIRFGSTFKKFGYGLSAVIEDTMNHVTLCPNGRQLIPLPL